MLASIQRWPPVLVGAAALLVATAAVLLTVAMAPLLPRLGGGRAEAATVTVRVGDTWFCDPTGPQPCGQPHDTAVNVGDTVVWEWGPGGSGTLVVHTTTHCADNFTTCGGPKEWDSSPAKTTGTFSHPFGAADAGKTFLYRCEIHPTTMQGRIIVQAATPTPTSTPTPTATPTSTPTPGPGVDTDGDTIPNGTDIDDDNDGYVDTDETTKGSDPFQATSTPEHADGIDNDADTVIDEQPAGANWDIDADTVVDSLDASVDTDGDGVSNTTDLDDDGDGIKDSIERKMSTDELGDCPTNTSHDAWPSDRDRDKDADIGDVIASFNGKILNPKAYDARSDADGDHDNDIGDIIILYGNAKILTKCAVFTFTNNTGGAVDDIHIQWMSAIAEVFSARDSDRKGWSNRTISGGGLTLDMDRPDAQGDLASGGQLRTVVRGTSPIVSSCQWTLDGVNKGTC